jgi:hypothetical protein
MFQDRRKSSVRISVMGFFNFRAYFLKSPLEPHMKLARLVDHVKPAATSIAFAKEFSRKRRSSLKNTTSNFFFFFVSHFELVY